ncbi:hypothetical protein NMG60_11036198 [Bertholletia excelsa]
MGGAISISHVLEQVKEKGREMRLESWISYAGETFTQTGRKIWAENWTGKLNTVVHKLGEMDAECVKKYSVEKLKGVPVLVEQFFPADARDKLCNWAWAVKPWIITAAVFLLIYRCCCGGGGRGGSGKTMKAPGRNHRMRRADFEENPQAYFRSLRGKGL